MSIYLYIKTHQKTGLKYFGKTARDPYKYKGSGTYWKLHLRKHGNHVDTEVLGCYTEDEVVVVATKFSHDHNIAESSEWANLIDENGLDGGYTGEIWNKGKKCSPLSEEHKAKVSAALKGHVVSEETKAKISAGKKGKKRTEEQNSKQSKRMTGKKRGRYATRRTTNRRWQHTEESKLKMSDVKKGRLWYHNESESIMRYEGEQPEGFVRGRRKWKACVG